MSCRLPRKLPDRTLMCLLCKNCFLLCNKWLNRVLPRAWIGSTLCRVPKAASQARSRLLCKFCRASIALYRDCRLSRKVPKYASHNFVVSVVCVEFCLSCRTKTLSCLRPTSITLSGSKLVRSWSQTRQVRIWFEAGRRPAASWNLAYHLAC